MMAAYVKRVKLELIPTAMSSPARPFEASKLADRAFTAAVRLQRGVILGYRERGISQALKK